MENYKTFTKKKKHRRKSFLVLRLDKEFLGLTSKAVYVRDFPGGAVVKNPPANAGDVGSIPGPERSHMLRSN